MAPTGALEEGMCVVCVLCVHVIMLRMTLKEFLLDSKESRRVLSKQASKSASMQASKSASMQASMQVSRQASKQTGKQACNVQEGKQAGKQASRKASKQASKQAGKQASRQASKQESKHASQQACQQAGKQAEKQAGKQAVKHKSTWKAFSRSHALEGLVIFREASDRKNSKKGCLLAAAKHLFKWTICLVKSASKCSKKEKFEKHLHMESNQKRIPWLS